MQLYLPIAELSVNTLLILVLGGGVGLISGLFGVGGGFLLTPLLIFIGVPPAVAVSTQAPQIVASSFSGLLAHLKRDAVDLRMGGVLVIGGLIGSWLGVVIFRVLRELGQVEVTVSILYVVFLAIVGGLMAVESVRALRRTESEAAAAPPRRRSRWMHQLPLKVRFKKSQLYISAIPLIFIGFVIGVLGAVMGVGGGFIMLPAMIYIIGVPTKVVVGTSLFQITIVMVVTTMLHAVQNKTVDAVLALVLLLGGVVGAQIGAGLGARIRGETLRFLLAALVLAVAAKLLYDLVVEPSELFVLEPIRE